VSRMLAEERVGADKFNVGLLSAPITSIAQQSPLCHFMNWLRKGSGTS
jgi:hypothetical protein